MREKHANPNIFTKFAIGMTVVTPVTLWKLGSVMLSC